MEQGYKMELRRSRWLVASRALRAVLVMITVSGVLGAQQTPAPQTPPQPGTPQTGTSAAGLPKIGPTTLDYSTTRSFPNVFAPYESRLVPESSMTHSQRLHSLIRDGKLYLS